MTRARVLSRLAEHGRPQMWADEQEAAALSGMSYEQFRLKLSSLEARGFPRKNADNNRRSIVAILAFWRLPSNDPTANGPATERGLERWN